MKYKQQFETHNLPVRPRRRLSFYEFHEAATRNDLPGIETLLQDEEHARWLVENEDAAACPLPFAAKAGHVESVQLLLAHCNPHLHNEDGHTPLMLAILHDKSACVGALMHVSDLSHRDQQGRTPLMLAAESSDAHALEALLPHSDARAVCVNGMTALMRAVRRGDAKSVQALLPHSDVHAVDKTGLTALAIAAQLRLDGAICEPLLLSHIATVPSVGEPSGAVLVALDTPNADVLA